MNTPARILLVGAGGLGCAVADALARAGVRALTACDDDRVELTNLHRQLLHRTEDVGTLKVQSLARALPAVAVRALAVRVAEANAAELIGEHDLVVDASDGAATKFLLNDACVRAGVPLVHGGALGLRGQVTIVLPGGPCLRCLFEAPPAAEPGTCAEAGVLAPVVGVIAAAQAAEALKLLQQVGRPLSGRLLSYDGARARFRVVCFARNPRCTGCGPQRTEVTHAA